MFGETRILKMLLVVPVGILILVMLIFGAFLQEKDGTLSLTDIFEDLITEDGRVDNGVNNLTESPTAGGSFIASSLKKIDDFLCVDVYAADDNGLYKYTADEFLNRVDLLSEQELAMMDTTREDIKRMLTSAKEYTDIMRTSECAPVQYSVYLQRWEKVKHKRTVVDPETGDKHTEEYTTEEWVTHFPRVTARYSDEFIKNEHKCYWQLMYAMMETTAQTNKTAWRDKKDGDKIVTSNRIGNDYVTSIINEFRPEQQFIWNGIKQGTEPYNAKPLYAYEGYNEDGKAIKDDSAFGEGAKSIEETAYIYVQTDPDKWKASHRGTLGEIRYKAKIPVMVPLIICNDPYVSMTTFTGVNPNSSFTSKNYADAAGYGNCKDITDESRRVIDKAYRVEDVGFFLDTAFVTSPRFDFDEFMETLTYTPVNDEAKVWIQKYYDRYLQQRPVIKDAYQHGAFRYNWNGSTYKDGENSSDGYQYSEFCQRLFPAQYVNDGGMNGANLKEEMDYTLGEHSGLPDGSALDRWRNSGVNGKIIIGKKNMVEKRLAMFDTEGNLVGSSDNLGSNGGYTGTGEGIGNVGIDIDLGTCTNADVQADINQGLYTWEDYVWMATTIQREGGTANGAYAVACCIANRARSGGSIKSIVTARGQFDGVTVCQQGPNYGSLRPEAAAMVKNQSFNGFSAAAARKALRGDESAFKTSPYQFEFTQFRGYAGASSHTDLWIDTRKVSEFYVYGGNVYVRASEYKGLHCTQSLTESDKPFAIICCSYPGGDWKVPRDEGYHWVRN